MIKVLFCGKDKFIYHRTRVILKGIEKTPGISATVFPISKRDSENASTLSKLSAENDFVFVPAFRHKDVAWVKKHSNAPVVFDPLISEYLTKVIDYGQWYKAPTKYLLDFRAIHAADYLIADTQAMKDYYGGFFHFPPSKTAVVPVGYIADDFSPLKNNNDNSDFHTGFYGSFVPLQGTDVIAKAASLLRNENIVFDIIGNGATYKSFLSSIEKMKVPNIRLLGWLPYKDLSEAISRFDVALGIFGGSGKAARVIPNKLFHYAAMKKCIITLDSKAVREIFSPGENIIGIKRDAETLAETILKLKEDTALREKIAGAGCDLVSESFNEISIAKTLLRFLTEIKSSQ